MEHLSLSLWELCEGNLDGGGSGRLWRQASLSTGAPLRKLEEGSFTKDYEQWIKEGISLCGSSVRGTWREGSFTGEPKGYAKEGSGNGHLSPGRGLIYWGTLKDE